jgi:hypothetical protein
MTNVLFKRMEKDTYIYIHIYTYIYINISGKISSIRMKKEKEQVFGEFLNILLEENRE